MNLTAWENQAISAATAGAWEKAIDLNQKILQVNAKNVSALNRLARAFLENCQIDKARQTYQRVLKVDQYNPIASKNLKRLTGKKQLSSRSKTKKPVLATAFLEEPRKTKLIRVVRLTSAQGLAEVESGDEVKLILKKRFVGVVSQQDIHLGCLPEDISQRLIVFINGGNHYRAFVKTVERNSLEVMVKETRRSKKFKNQPSF
ncbi:hypothetical protein COU97_02725 [Candidatus Shapirobacteria bacterium CG10_big_fil_rev_8_21_14_0_10_48_15]|uniref:Uncharacterized protein n=1 Tax=Candidatus Shapirobacteria bacterium CG10_big_fil_rev_8_21_14_0_10_48_15 TaxID=1974484 RepID=A0A2M8L6M0_9BACT|nr:MAG: hypothetical protein COU97_02725 [Candidatus Shapirobacteria bacterium CG10_big_fil_rev_8_21_14_0_10_48_15]